MTGQVDGDDPMLLVEIEPETFPCFRGSSESMEDRQWITASAYRGMKAETIACVDQVMLDVQTVSSADATASQASWCSSTLRSRFVFISTI